MQSANRYTTKRSKSRIPRVERENGGAYLGHCYFAADPSCAYARVGSTSLPLCAMLIILPPLPCCRIAAKLFALGPRTHRSLFRFVGPIIEERLARFNAQGPEWEESKPVSFLKYQLVRVDELNGPFAVAERPN